MPGGHRAGAGTEPTRRTAVATRGPEGIFPMKTRPGSMDWHNASTLPINWHGASPARPIPNWRSKPSAVAPVDDIDWVNGNLVGYRRTVKKLIRGPIPYSGAKIPCSAKIIPCSIC
jgi:hypothetical protein